MIDTDKYEGHTPGPWKTNPNDLGTWIDGSSNEGIATVHNYAPANRANCELIAAAPLLLEFIQKIVKEWNMPNKCNQEFGKDVRQLMYEYGLITFNEETRRYEVMKND